MVDHYTAELKRKQGFAIVLESSGNRFRRCTTNFVHQEPSLFLRLAVFSGNFGNLMQLDS